MQLINWSATEQFIHDEIIQFHEKRLKRLEKTNLKGILRKNPYLFRAKNLLTASELITSMLDARLSSSEEKMFGDFLERTALFITAQTVDGRKSSARGIDLEFTEEQTRYLVSIKSGPNWGNSSQYQSLRTNFKNAVRIIRQAETGVHLQPILGICYGKAQRTDTGDYIKLIGQSFWHFISDDPELYLRIIEPIAFQSREYDERMIETRAAIENKLVREFANEYCFEDGRIDWNKLVSFNSENLK